MKRRNTFKRLGYIISFIVIIYFIYNIYKFEIYRWSCMNEDVAPSCLIAGLIKEEENNLKDAIKFFKLACNKKYGISCGKLSEFYKDHGDGIQSKKFQKLACDNQAEQYCESKK